MGSEVKKAPDWRNTLYQFHEVAVEKHGFRSQEIAIYTALLSKVKKSGFIKMGNNELMRLAGIANWRTFNKARDRLIETKVISIIDKGVAKLKYTTYKVTLIGKPKPKKQNEHYSKKPK